MFIFIECRSQARSLLIKRWLLPLSAAGSTWSRARYINKTKSLQMRTARVPLSARSHGYAPSESGLISGLRVLTGSCLRWEWAHVFCFHSDTTTAMLSLWWKNNARCIIHDRDRNCANELKYKFLFEYSKAIWVTRKCSGSRREKEQVDVSEWV
jgi:hypothetical protein